MDCSACGQRRPSAIELANVDLNSLMAYHAGSWNIGIRSRDGVQDFRGVLRGELGSGPHDPALVSDNKRLALNALLDLHDLIYLWQNPQAAPPPATAAPAKGKTGPASAAATRSDAASTTNSLGALASAGDVEAILARQGSKAGSGDINLALETAYAARARHQMLNGYVDAALQTLGVARQKFGRSPGLRDREAHYVVIGDTYDRLRFGVRLDVGGLQSYLQEIRSLEPSDAKSIELMLARTLANRIADQRASGREKIADDLLNSGRDLFPASADLLSQGRNGELPTDGVEEDAMAPQTDTGGEQSLKPN
jgi:hypothetical protein